MTDSRILIPSHKVIKPEDITLEDLRHLGKDSFALWALTSGARVDHNAVDFNTHRYLLPIYMDNTPEIAWIKASQLGATSWILLKILWWLENNPGRKAGLYFPTKEGVENLSKDRLTPLIDTCPSIKAITEAGDKLGLRKIGSSSFYLYHLGGVASKDSVPLDFVAFDEVRLCSPKDIDQALERVSHSPYKLKMFLSTCGIPNVDIHARYLDGTQYVWQSTCGCPEGIDLARTFPACVVDDDASRNNEPYLRCPKCKWEIKDPQNGRYVSHNPKADYNSYHVSQLASKYISLKDVWKSFQRTTNIEEFYNAKLGLPYVDEANRGVTEEVCLSSVREDLTWGNKERVPCAMGVDQGAGYCVVTIASMSGSEKRLRHVEVIEQNNPDYKVNGNPVTPFRRLRSLMKEFNVQLCVVDAMPNVNDAIAFAQEFPKRVFLAYYAKENKDIVLWGDKVKYKPAVQKAGPLLKFKYTCVLNRFASLNVSLGAWQEGDVILPDPEKLWQYCADEKTGQIKPEPVAKRLFKHLCSLVKRFRVTNEETGEGKNEFVLTGPDHLAHSWNYCNMALERQRRTVNFVFA
jgi:hypothetical protein